MLLLQACSLPGQVTNQDEMLTEDSALLSDRRSLSPGCIAGLAALSVSPLQQSRKPSTATESVASRDHSWREFWFMLGFRQLQPGSAVEAGSQPPTSPYSALTSDQG